MESTPGFLRKHVVGLSTMLLALMGLVAPAVAQQKPNILAAVPGRHLSA
jgi:hypothetical protein